MIPTFTYLCGALSVALVWLVVWWRKPSDAAYIEALKAELEIECIFHYTHQHDIGTAQDAYRTALARAERAKQ
jgi:hypothetical protein